MNVTRAIVLRQRDFFMRGPKFLHPMRLQEIAGQNGRRVGIISHREELDERIGVQIRVVKKGEGRSRIELHGTRAT